jgi:hypothetical protein
MKINQRTAADKQGAIVFVFQESWDLVFCIMVGTFKAVKCLYDYNVYKCSDQDYQTSSSFDIPPM